MAMKESRKVFIGGTGKSGIAAAKMILEMGGEALLYNSDENTDAENRLGAISSTKGDKRIDGITLNA